VRQIAEAEKLDVVFQNEQVVWASNRIDITDKVIKALGRESRRQVSSGPRTYRLGEIVARLGGELMGTRIPRSRIATLESAGPATCPSSRTRNTEAAERHPRPPR